MFEFEMYAADMIIVTSDAEMEFVISNLPKIGDGTIEIINIVDLGYTGNKRINLSKCGAWNKENYYALQEFKKNEFKKFKKKHKDPVAKKQKRIDCLKNQLAILDEKRQKILNELSHLES